MKIRCMGDQKHRLMLLTPKLKYLYGSRYVLTKVSYCTIKSKIMQFGWYGIAFILFSLSNAKMFMLQMHTILLQKFSETAFEWVEAGLTSFV